MDEKQIAFSPNVFTDIRLLTAKPKHIPSRLCSWERPTTSIEFYVALFTVSASHSLAAFDLASSGPVFFKNQVSARTLQSLPRYSPPDHGHLVSFSELDMLAR
jgi:hypothetical protein